MHYSPLSFASLLLLWLTCADAVGNSDPAQPKAASSCTMEDEWYTLINKTQLSHDSYLLRFQIPDGRAILGSDPTLPTCLSLEFPYGTHAESGQHPVPLRKSYSPISHPSTVGYFELVVKQYPVVPGGGVGAFLCRLPLGQAVLGKVKEPRIMHVSPVVQGRWKHVGLIAGGTGIAPLLQIARILLASPHDRDTKIYILSVNRHHDEILMRDELDRLAREYPERIQLTYALTSPEAARQLTVSNDDRFVFSRGSVALARQALPPPTKNATMILICGKDGFVQTWAGPVIRAPPKPGKAKGPKIQGPLLGILAEAGYDASQVFKY